MASAGFHALEEPTPSLNTLELLPSLRRRTSLQEDREGRQRSPAYVTCGESVAARSIAAKPPRKTSFHSATDGDAGATSEGNSKLRLAHITKMAVEL